jgi:hypothetical protein
LTFEEDEDDDDQTGVDAIGILWVLIVIII